MEFEKMYKFDIQKKSANLHECFWRKDVVAKRDVIQMKTYKLQLESMQVLRYGRCRQALSATIAGGIN